MASIRRALKNVVDDRLAKLGFELERDLSIPQEGDWTYYRHAKPCPHTLTVDVDNRDRTVLISVNKGPYTRTPLLSFYDHDYGWQKPVFQDQTDLEQVLTEILDNGLDAGLEYLERGWGEPFDIECALEAVRREWAGTLSSFTGCSMWQLWSGDYLPVEEYMRRARRWHPREFPESGERDVCWIQIIRSKRDIWSLAGAAVNGIDNVPKRDARVVGERWLHFEPIQEDVERCLRAIITAAIRECEVFLEEIRAAYPCPDR